MQDKWQETVVACGMVGNDRVHLEQSLQAIEHWVETNWPDMQCDGREDRIDLRFLKYLRFLMFLNYERNYFFGPSETTWR